MEEKLMTSGKPDVSAGLFSFQYRNLFFEGVAVVKTAAPSSNIILEYYIIRGITG